VGLKIAQKDPDERFPYGYFKAENISALFISLFIIYVAYELFLSGIEAFSETSSINYPLLSMGAALVSVVISFLLSKYLIRKGEETNSQSLIANGKEKMTDVITSSIVLLTIIFSYYRVAYIEGVVTMLLALFIMREGLLSAKDSIFSLMDVSPKKEVERQIIKIISEVPGVEGFGNLKLRKSGPFIFGEVEVMIRKLVNVNTARRICNEVEDKAKKRVEGLTNLTISIIPYEAEEKKVVMPVKEKGENPEIMRHFGRANYFLMVVIRGGKVKSREFISNKFKGKEVRAGLSAAHFVVKEGVDSIIIREIGEISFHVLRDHLIDVYVAKKGKSKYTIDNFIQNKLETLKKPTKEGFEYL
jgi:cation diffusion facilitator family transporter